MSLILSKFGIMGGNTGEKVRVLHLEDGYFSTTANWAIGRIIIDGKFNAQPTGYFFTSKRDLFSGDYIGWLFAGQTFCARRDGGYVYAYPTAYTFATDDFYAWNFYENLGGNQSAIYKDNVLVRSVTVSNYMVQNTSYVYQLYMFEDGIDMDIKRIRVYDTAGTLKYDWDYENGETDISKFTNGTIKEVSV